MNRSRGRQVSEWFRSLLAAGMTMYVLGSVGCDVTQPIANTTGFLAETVNAETHHDRPYVVFVPHEPDSVEKPPVILFLNGWGQNGDDGLRQVSNNFGQDVWRRRNQMPFLAVCPQCSKDGYWAPGKPGGVDVTDASLRGPER